jgi:hypothetical protein
VGLTRSPISGPAGNVEFLAHLRSASEGELTKGVETLPIDLAIEIDRVLSGAG